MKLSLMLLLVISVLAGCGQSKSSLDQAALLRERILQCDTCEFDGEITVDYGDEVYAFTLHCYMTNDGDVNFSVVSPEVISGIKGVITSESGTITFDDTVLAFEMIVDELVTPIAAPWIMLHALRGGYIQCSSSVDHGFYLQINDSYRGTAVKNEIWLNEAYIPTRCEMLWNGRRLLSMNITNFTIV